MKKTWKRLISLLLAVFLVAAMLPAPVARADFTLPAAPTLTNFERVDTIPEGGLDTNKKYLILTQTTDGTTYALYASDAGRSIACGDLTFSTSGTCAVKLTIADGKITGFQHMLSESTAQIGLENLLFTVAKGTSDPAKYTFTANGSGLDIVGNKMFKDGTSEVSVALRTTGTTGTGVFDIYNGTLRFLYFNDPADSNSAFQDTAKHATDFCAFSGSTVRHFPIYLYAYSNAATAQLEAAIANAEALKDASEYTQESRDALEAPLAAAKAARESVSVTQDAIDAATQAQIDAAATALNDAIDALVRIAPTIEGYELVTTLDDVTDGYYLIVANTPDGYYVLYPGATGTAQNADNVRKLVVDSSQNATGWLKRDSSYDFTVTDSAAFSAAHNTIRPNSDGTYAVTALNGSTTYQLYVGNGASQAVYQTNESWKSTLTFTPSSTKDGCFYIQGPYNSYLIYYTTNKNFNQNSTLTDSDGAARFQGEFLLFKSSTPLPAEPEQPAFDPDTALGSGFTRATTAALDTTKYYIIVAKDSDNNLYALYPAAGCTSLSPGSAIESNKTKIAAPLTVTNGAVTAADLSGSAVELSKLYFTVEGSAGSYSFLSGSVALSLGSAMFSSADSPAVLTLELNGSDGHTIKTATGSRYLAFNKAGDPNQFLNGDSTYETNFWGPGGKQNFSIYLYAVEGETAPTAWDNLNTFYETVKDLAEADYTKATWSAFETARQTAESALTTYNSDKQNEALKTALTALRSAYNSLQERPQAPDVPTATVYLKDTDGLDDNGIYAIYAPTTNDNNPRLMHNSGDKTDQCGATLIDADHVSLGGCGDAHLWKVVPMDGGFAIQGMSNGAYLTSTPSGSQLALSSSPEVFTVETNGDGYSLKSAAGKYVYFGSSWGVRDSAYKVQFFQQTEEALSDSQLIKDWRSMVPQSGTTQDQPFASGTGGSNNFRIPAMITLRHQAGANAGKNGRIVAAIDARWNHQGDACSLDTILSWSDDNGANWKYSFPNYFGDSTNAKDLYATSLIDPVIVEANDGTIYMMVDAYSGGVAINTAPMTSEASTGYALVGGTQRLVLYTTGQAAEQTNDNWSYYVGDFVGGFAQVLDRSDDSKTGFYVDDYYYIYYDRSEDDALGVDGDKLYCQQLGSNKFVQQNVFFFYASLHVRCTSFLWITKSTDGGESWGAPQLVNGMVRTGADIFYGVGPGAGLSFMGKDASDNDVNVILLPAYTYSNQISSFIYSSDNGKTWTRSDNATTSAHWSSESCLVQIDDTTVRHFYRDGTNTLWYTDHTWNPASKTFTVKGSPVDTGVTKRGGNGCQLSAIKYSEQIDGKDAIIVSTPAATDSRTNGKLYVFLVNNDADKTLTHAYTYEVTGSSAAYAYSSITETSDGNIADLYEGANIVFTVIPIENIIPTAEAKGYSGKYDGAPHSITVTVTGGQDPQVQYSADNTNWSAAAPTFTDAGTYTVYYKVVGTLITGSAAVNIDPSDSAPAVTISPDTPSITGDGTVTLTISGVPQGAGGTVTVTNSPGDSLTVSGPDDNGQYTVQETLHATGLIEKHTYTVTYSSTNYSLSATATCEVVVNPVVSGADFTVTAKGYSGAYDGQAHSIEVTTSDSDVTVLYCKTVDGTYSTAKPTFTSTGTHVVYYQATKDGKTIAGSATVLISKANPDMVITAPHNYVYDAGSPLTIVISGVPTADQGTFSLSCSDDEIQRKTSQAMGGTVTWTATPILPEEVRTYTFVAIFEPGENSNYNRFVRTCVVAVTVNEPAPLNFNFSHLVSFSPDDPMNGFMTIPFDGNAHSVADALSYPDRSVSVTYAVGEDSDEYTDAVPSFTDAGTYIVNCLGADKNGELDSRLLVLTLTITENTITPDIQLSASPAMVSAGSSVKLTLSGVPATGSVKLTCSDPSVVIPVPNWDGTYTVTMPDAAKTYTFTAVYTPALDTPYLSATTVCAVIVSAGSTGGNPGGSGGGSAGNPGGVTNPDGSTTTTVTDPNTGAVTATTQKPDGTVQVVVTDPDGSTTATSTAPNGVVMLATSEPGKDVNVSVLVPAKVPETVVSVPAAIDYTTVAVNKKTGETVMLSVPTKELDAMQIKLNGSADLTLVKIGNSFTDVSEKSWAKDAVDFTFAHGLFQGTSATTFSPDQSMTRGMLVTVLARLDGVDTSGGSSWYAKGAQWAQEQGISDVSRLGSNVTREQLATMLWRYAGCPEATGGLDGYSDGSQVSGYASQAMSWAVEQGIFRGVGGGALNPKGSATRAQVSTVILRLCEYLVK